MRDGKSEYISKRMGRDSVLAGVWKADEYLGKEVLSPYVIGYRNNIGRVTCMKIGEKPYYVKYKFSRAGELSSFLAISNLLMQGSPGSESITTTFTGFEAVTFPFEGKVNFKAPNSLNTGTLDCELRFIINAPGTWLVTLYY